METANATHLLPGWGPERPLFAEADQPAYAVFNSITDNTLVGDERDFVRIGEMDSEDPYTSELTIEPDKRYEVFIYLRNDASTEYDDAEHDYAGVSLDTRLATSFPDMLEAGQSSSVTATIRSSNAQPEQVWDAARITASEALTLHYVPESAIIHNRWDANGKELPTSLFANPGVLMGLNDLDGLIPGGIEFATYVTYTIQTKAMNNAEATEE